MKRLGIVIQEELHKQAKMRALSLGKTLTDYIITLIRQDLQKK